MRVFVSFVLFLCVFTGSVQGQRGRLADPPLLRKAVSRLFAIPAVVEKMAWKNGGVPINDIIALMRILEPEAYEVWLSSSRDYSHRRFLLGATIHNEMRGEVFSLFGPFKLSAYEYLDDSTNYFLGEAEPDIRELISDVLLTPEILAKLEWKSGGLTIEAILTAFKEKHPDVYTLYKEAYYHKTDAWLRDLIQGRMYSYRHTRSDERRARLGDYFTMRVTVAGESVAKFFRGRHKPDLERSIVMAISNAGLIKQMVDSGVTMDEIVAALKDHSRVYTLYVQASGNGSEHALRTALGVTMSKMDEVVSREDSDGIKRYFWQ